MSDQFPLGTPGVYYTPPKPQKNPQLPDFQQPPSQEYVKEHYWSFPINVERYRNAYLALKPEEKAMVPDWLNPEALDAAHNYYANVPENKGKFWTDWKAPENDEMAPIMANLPPPPRDLISPTQQYLSNYTSNDYDQYKTAQSLDPNGQVMFLSKNDLSTLPQNVQEAIVGSLGDQATYSIPATMAQQIQSMLPQQAVEQPKTMKDLQASGEWNNIPALDKLQIWAQSQKYAGAASGALQGVIPAGVQALTGNFAGAATSLAIAAGLGQGSQTQGVIGEISKNLMALFNIGAETVERGVGVTGQALGSALFPQWYGDFGELMKNLPEAWQAAAITYESANIGSLFGQMTQNTHQLGETDKTVINNYEDDALTSMYNLRRELEDVYEGRSPKSVDEVLFGYKESQNVVDRYVAKYGVEGQNRNLVFQLAADPINFSGAAIGKVGEKVAAKFGLDALAGFYKAGRWEGTAGQAIAKSAQAFMEGGPQKVLSEPAFTGYKPMDTGGVSPIREYIHDLQINPEKYKDIKTGALFDALAGMKRDKDGSLILNILTPEYSEKTKNAPNILEHPVKAIQYAFLKSPEAAGSWTLNHVSDAIIRDKMDENISPEQFGDRLNKMSTMNPQEMKEAGIAAAGTTGVTQLFPQISDKFQPKVDGIKDNFNNTQEPRQYLNMVGELASIPEGERVKFAMQDPKTYLQKAIDNLAKETDVNGKPKTPEQIKLDQENAKALSEVTPEMLAEYAKVMDDTKAPITAEAAKEQMAQAVLDSTRDWAIDNFGIQEHGFWGKLADGVKNLESFILLFPNPMFMLQNVMTNGGHAFVDGLAGSVFDPVARRGFWEQVGYRPDRVEAGVGDISRGGKTTGLAAKQIGEIEKLAKGKALSAFAPLENMTGAIKRSFGGGFTRLSNRNEVYFSEVVATSKANSVLNENMRVGKGLDPVASQDRITLGELKAKQLETAMNGAKNEAEVIARLGNGHLATDIEPKLLEALDNYGMKDLFLQKVADAGNDVGKIRDAIDEVLEVGSNRVSKAELDNIERESENNAMAIVRADGQSSVPTVLQSLDSDRSFNMLQHQKILDEITKERNKDGVKGDKKYAEQSLAELKRMNIFEQRYEATAKGVAKGLGIDADNAGIIVNLHNSYLNHSGYFGTAKRWWGAVSEIIGGNKSEAAKVEILNGLNEQVKNVLGDKYDPLANPTDNVRSALSQEYLNMIERESTLTDAINQPFLDKVLKENPDGYNGFKEYLDLQKANRKEQTAAQYYFRTGEDIGLSKETKELVDGVLGGYALDELRNDPDPAMRQKYNQAWQDFQDKVYTPLWYKNVDAERMSYLNAWYQAQGMMPAERPKVEVKPEVPVEQVNRFQPVDDAIANWDTLKPADQRQVMAQLEQLYGLSAETTGARVRKIKNFIKKYVGEAVPVKKSVGEKSPFEMTSKEFYKKYRWQHSILKEGSDLSSLESEGFKTGIGPNVWSITDRDLSKQELINAMDRKYATTKGKTVYALPPDSVKDSGNGPKVKEGYKPNKNEKVTISRDYEPMHEAFVRQAIENGETIPTEVLAEYPELAKLVPEQKEPDWNPTTLKQALSKMSDEDFARHWAGYGDNGKANTLSPAPEQAQTLLTPPVYKPQTDYYGELKTDLLRWKQDHIDNPVKKYEGGFFDGLDAEQKKVAEAYLADRFRQMKDVVHVAVQHGIKARDFTLLNYNDRSRMDNTLMMMFPYHFWYTHSMMNWGIRALDRPGIMATYAKLKNYANGIQNDPNQPTRLKGKVFLPMPFMPSNMGKGIYVDPLRNIIPIDNFLRPIETFDKNQSAQYKSAVSILQDLVDNEGVTYEDALNAIKTKSGDLWDSAWSKAGAQLDNPGIMDYAQMLIAPHMPISWLIKAYNGQTDTISQLPFTRMVQTVTGGLGIASDKDLFGGLISPAGVNLEAWPRKALGLPMQDKFMDYRVERELSIMASENPQMVDQSIQAMIDKQGAVYNEAVRRVMGQGLAKYGGTQLAMDFLPEGEMGQRKLREPYAKAADAYANGDTTALNTFFSAHPEYAAQQALWRKPDSRMMMYLKSLVWEQYNALPDLQKKEFADQAGSLFQDAFLNKQTRSYASISNETYATWAQALGAMIPETANPSQLKVNYSDPQIVKDYQTFKDMKDQYFPNISEMQSYANTLPKDQQAEFYQQNPIMGQYSAFRDQYMAQYPEVAKAWQQEGTDLAGLPQNAIQAVYQFRADKEKLFPNIDEITNYYFSLPDAAQKRAFMLDHPEIENFWSWRTSIAANNPQAAYHIIGADSLGNSIRGQFNVEEAFPGIYDMQNEYFSYPKGSQARKNFLSGHPTLTLYWDWKGLIGDETQMEAQFAKEYVAPIMVNASDELKNSLSGYYFAGQPLTQGALAELQSLFVMSGQIGGNLNTFVGLLKTGF